MPKKQLNEYKIVAIFIQLKSKFDCDSLFIYLFSTNPELEIVFVLNWFAELAEQFQVHNLGTYIALIILWDFWMVWTASSHFRVVLTSNDLILSSPCQENHKREMWTISDKKLNAFLAFLTLSWAWTQLWFQVMEFLTGPFSKKNILILVYYFECLNLCSDFDDQTKFIYFICV